jgi:adenine-specific DNA methylase
MLAHYHERCTGTWRLGDQTVICSRCGRTYPTTPETSLAAMEENFAGSLLQRAAERGSVILARERARAV